MDACLILGRLLYVAPSSNALIIHLVIKKYRLPRHWVSESARQERLPVMCQAVVQLQPDRQCATCQAWHDHTGVTNIENCTQ
jgi:hypothetical protein